MDPARHLTIPQSRQSFRHLITLHTTAQGEKRNRRGEALTLSTTEQGRRRKRRRRRRRRKSNIRPVAYKYTCP
jgi:hypothetical protein